MTGLDVTVTVHDIPDVPAGLGWIGAALTVICGDVVGEVIVTIDSTGHTTREAMLDLDSDTAGLGLARIVTDNPVLLRRVAAVATILADHLAG